MQMFGFGKKKAKWTEKTHLFSPDEYICSNCGYSCEKAFRECPRCHSEMGGSDYEPSWVDEAEMMDILFGDD